VFRGARIRIVRTPIQAPQANGIAERFVRTVRSECLDWLLIVNTLHLERVVSVFVDHYNQHRAHRSLNLMPPVGRAAINDGAQSNELIVMRRDRLGACCMSISALRDGTLNFRIPQHFDLRRRAGGRITI